MSAFRPHCRPTAVGSLPHLDAAEACAIMLRYLPEIPVWPQLPQRDPAENMYVQYFGRLPGAATEQDKVWVDRGDALERGLEQLYADYLSGETAGYDVPAERAAGYAAMKRLLKGRVERPLAVKGQVTGPISAGLQITDRQLRPILYDEVLSDALAKYLRLVATAQERALGELADETIIFLDEPFLNAVGSAFIQVRAEHVVQLLSEVMAGLRGRKGIHCCGNTDWSLLLATPLDVLSFDAYNYADTLALYASEVKRFLERGGVLAWGIVPTEANVLEGESAESLVRRLREGMALLAGKGIDRGVIVAGSLVTPSCGLGTLAPAEAERALSLTAEVSLRIRDEMGVTA